MANIAISLKGIDETIANLNYRPGSVKQKAISAIRAFYTSEDSIKERTEIDADLLISSIWDLDNHPSKIKAKRRNFSSIKSSINADLEKNSKKGQNNENLIITDSNIFDMSEEAKNNLLSSFSDAVKTGDINFEQATSLLKAVTTFLDNFQADNTDTDAKDIVNQIKKILDKITETVLSEDEPVSTPGLKKLKKGPLEFDGGNGPGKGEVNGPGKDGDTEGNLDADEPAGDEAIELIDEPDEDVEEIELDEDETLEDIDALDEDVEEIALDEDEELEDIEELDEDVEVVELDEDEELEDINGPGKDGDTEGNLDADEPAGDEAIELIDGPDEDVEEIELDEDETLEDIDALDEDVEEIALDEDEELEDVDELDEDVEVVELDEDEELEDINGPGKDGDTEGNLDADEPAGDEAIELIDGPDEDVEEIELDEDEALEDIEGLDEDEELEDVDELDEEELKALEEFREKRALAEYFDKTLGEREKRYNRYVTVPEGKYTIGTKKSAKSSIALQQFDMPKVFIAAYPVTNSLFEIFIEETGFVTTAEKSGFGRVYASRYKKDINGSTWNKNAGSEDVRGACWFAPSGPGSTLHGKRNHPVVQISVDDAMAFASWIGRRLPTEAEWEAAARTDRGYKYPWGNEFNARAFNIESSGLSGTSAVDEYDAFSNEFKIADMLGNVMEWTTDTERPPIKSKGATLYCVAKGAAWNAKDDATISSRALFKNGFTANTVGFRCISEIFL